jgi:hypothetical protein
MLLYALLVFVVLLATQRTFPTKQAIALIWIPFLVANTLWWYFGYPPQRPDKFAPQPIGADGPKPTAREFLFQEHKILADEIATQLSELWSFERFAIGGAAAIVAWLATHEVNLNEAWWLPLIFICLCAGRFAAGMVHIVWRLSVYVQKIEAEFLGESGGYEMWFRKQFVVQTVAHVTVWVAAIFLAFFAGELGPIAVVPFSK